jgi:hypothetical protein
MPMPETAIHENGNLALPPYEIWSSWDNLVPTPAGQFSLPQQ